MAIALWAEVRRFRKNRRGVKLVDASMTDAKVINKKMAVVTTMRGAKAEPRQSSSRSGRSARSEMTERGVRTVHSARDLRNRSLERRDRTRSPDRVQRL